MPICRLYLIQELVSVFPTWQHQIKKIFKRKQTCWDVAIKENQVKPAVDRKKDRKADKFPLIRGPMAFSFPKQQDGYYIPSLPVPQQLPPWAEQWLRLDSGLTTQQEGHILPHLPLPASFPEGTSRVVVTFSLTARSKTSKDSKEEKQVKRLQPGEEILPVSIP